MTIGLITLDCASLHDGDAAAVDLVARIKLAACTCGAELRLEQPSTAFGVLVDFCGLAEVLGVEVERQAEEREEPGGVEEEGELPDPPL